MGKLEELIQKISDLSFEDTFLLEEYIKLQRSRQNAEIIKTQSGEVKPCPHCGSEKLIKWCKYKGVQRFMCKSCNRTFLPTTGTAMHWLKKPNQFLNFVAIMFIEGENTLESESVRIGISKTTAFEWRHRALIALGSEAPMFKGETEIDDIWFRYSQKGRKGLRYARERGRSSHKGDGNYSAKVLITKGRDGEADFSLLKIGRLAAVDIGNKLSGKFESTATLISDKHPSISAFAKSENLSHENFRASAHTKEKSCHVQSVNSLARTLKDTINHQLRGVSTKYLQNYANWFSIREKYKGTKDKVKSMMIDCVSNTKAWDMNMNIEKLYERFILGHSVRTYRCPTKKSRKYQNWNLENAKSGVFI